MFAIQKGAVLGYRLMLSEYPASMFDVGTRHFRTGQVRRLRALDLDSLIEATSCFRLIEN
jgi:hypothetical protein